MAEDTEPKQDKMGHRDRLALAILIFSISSVSVLGAIIAWKAPDQRQNVMTAVLPLVGSWVGTVLAFYFSKDNFAAATRSVTEMSKALTSQEKLQTTLAKDKMIPRSQMLSIPVTSGQRLKEILNKLNEAKRARMPFLEQQDFPKYVIHRSVIDQFVASRALNPTSPPIALEDLTLEDLLTDRDWKDKIEQSIATVREDATLADVKAMMDQNPYCQDVFVTKGGGRTEPVLGWITNAIVEENTKL